MDTSSPHSTSFGKAAGLWAIYVLILFLFGGIAAGITWLAFIGLFDHEVSDVMYAVIFGVTGFVAYQLMRPVIEARRRTG